MKIAETPRLSGVDAPTLADLRNSSDCVKLLNTIGRISFMGEQSLRVMELTDMSEVVGKCWWEFWPTDQQAMIKSRFDAALAGDVQQFKTTRRMPSGKLKEWSITLSPVPGVNGVSTSVLVLSRDVTPAP